MSAAADTRRFVHTAGPPAQLRVCKSTLASTTSACAFVTTRGSVCVFGGGGAGVSVSAFSVLSHWSIVALFLPMPHYFH